MTGNQPGLADRRDIFDRIVENKTDLVGFVAFGLYRLREKEWSQAFVQQHGHPPAAADLETFCLSFQKDALESLRTDADGRLYAYADEEFNQKINEYKNDALQLKAREELEGIHRRLTKISGYRHHVIGHLIGFVVLVGLVAGVTVVAAYEPSISEFAGKLAPHKASEHVAKQ